MHTVLFFQLPLNDQSTKNIAIFHLFYLDMITTSNWEFKIVCLICYV